MKYALTHVTLLDGTLDMRPQPNMTVLVDEKGVISRIGPSAMTDMPLGTVEVNLSGKYLLPGLINMHVHLCGSGRPMSSSGATDLIDRVTGNPLGRAYLRHEIQKSAQTELMSGVTTVRSVGDPVWADVQTRNAINVGKCLGPRMLCSGWGVTPTNGHGRGLIAKPCETDEDARALVRDIFAHGADLVKLFITGGVFDAEKPGEPGLVRMSPQMARVTVEEAHNLNLPTAVHVESTEGMRLALEAGVDTIEHGAPMTSEIIELFYHNGAGRTSSLTTTISPAIPLARMDREKTHSSEIVKLNANVVFHGIVQACRQALDANVPVGLGTDSGCPYATQYDFWREMVYFHELVGASNSLALHTATLGNARLLHVNDITGSVEVGKSADLIVVARNPLEDLETLRHVEQVMMAGRLISHPQVRHLKNLDADLDAVLHIQPNENAL